MGVLTLEGFFFGRKTFKLKINPRTPQRVTKVTFPFLSFKGFILKIDAAFMTYFLHYFQKLFVFFCNIFADALLQLL